MVARGTAHLVFLAMSLLGEGGDGTRPPRRTAWRDGSHRAHLVFRAVAEEHRTPASDVDPRLVNALIALRQSFDPSERTGTRGWYGE